MKTRIITSIFVLFLVGSASSVWASLYQTGFETSEGYDVSTQYLVGQPSSGEIWRVIGANRFLVRDNVTFDNSTGSAWTSASSVTGTYGAYMDFNTDPTEGNSTVTMEFYIRPVNNAGTAGAVEVGLYQPGTTTRMLSIMFNEGNGKLMARNAGATSAYSDFSYTSSSWHHVGVEFDFATGNAQVFAKVCSSDTDTSPLENSDLVKFSSSSSGPFTSETVGMSLPAGDKYASRLFVLNSTGGLEANIDNISIIPEPATLGILFAGGIVGFIRRK